MSFTMAGSRRHQRHANANANGSDFECQQQLNDAVRQHIGRQKRE
jgi:hypothetical protein